MTTPDAPTAMTLEKALMLAAERKWRVTFYGEPFSVLIVDDFGDDIAHEGNWPESFSEALGYPVVERDPTAELVEALVGALNGGVIDEAAGLVSVDLTAYNAAVDALARHRGEQS